ncbi:uncharacterized protein LOC124161612 [Ischnura elegans]|uniref:uncharacterized protein LOC124161612 n=1 Tax=Ischnura elegans TaxID=197161 RepID=UPI001ED89FDD|nr:uncharacterized protein LOC124161612 [Ischnura elegans]
MQATHGLALLAVLVVSCGANGLSHRFYFPSQNLLLEAGRDRLYSTSGDVPEGSSRSGGSGSATVDMAPAPSQSPSPQQPSKIREPSRCSFAIVGCCRAGSMRVNDQCFEQFQCHGPFWGESPCRTESAVAAHNIVSKYYEAKEAEKRAQEAAAAAESAPAAAAPSRPEAEPEESSPFDPIGPLPSREDAMRHG